MTAHYLAVRIRGSFILPSRGTVGVLLSSIILRSIPFDERGLNPEKKTQSLRIALGFTCSDRTRLYPSSQPARLPSRGNFRILGGWPTVLPQPL